MKGDADRGSDGIVEGEDVHPSSSAEATGPFRGRILAASYKGPLPPAEQLQGYERCHKGAADRIIPMAEKQANHRQVMEKMALQAEIDDRKADRLEKRYGQTLGTLVCALVLASGVLLAVLAEAPGYGAGVITATLVGIAGVFVYGRISEAKEDSSARKTSGVNRKQSSDASPQHEHREVRAEERSR